ncbi:MAG: hypothetical protein HKO62_06565 [Gammaproteobacteria bacterium]|nr:hypothetical protein [Gammaproteobacteria bacterium]
MRYPSTPAMARTLFRIMSPVVALALILAVTLAPAAPAAAADVKPLTIISVDDHPWDAEPRFRSQTKTIFKGPNDSSLIYARFAPRWDQTPPMDPLGPHYHTWHEWAYVLSGDFVIHEPISEKQTAGMLSRFTQGTWLDRPAYTLHGGVWEVGGLRPQNACELIIFEEGDGSVVTLGENGDHFKPDFDSKPDPYLPDWRKVERFNHPWIVHSGSDLEWETDPDMPGRLVKWLSDDKAEGFRGRLLKIPPGWTPPPGAGTKHYKNANVMRYTLYGDMKVWQFAAPGGKGKPVKVSANSFIHQPPGALWGYGGGTVTDSGAIWLEVTYAEGVAVGGGPIEAPVINN